MTRILTESCGKIYVEVQLMIRKIELAFWRTLKLSIIFLPHVHYWSYSFLWNLRKSLKWSSTYPSTSRTPILNQTEVTYDLIVVCSYYKRQIHLQLRLEWTLKSNLWFRIWNFHSQVSRSLKGRLYHVFTTIRNRINWNFRITVEWSSIHGSINSAPHYILIKISWDVVCTCWVLFAIDSFEICETRKVKFRH